MTADRAIKEPCRVATANNIGLSGLFNVDGISLSIGDRVLVRQQINPAENGIWEAASSVWSRAPDFDSAGEVIGGTQVLVTSGNVFVGSRWRVAGNGAITVGVDPIAFSGVVGRAVSVLEYDADPTGQIDSTNAINTAIDDNPSVHIPAGTYRIDGTVTILSDYPDRKWVTMEAGAKLIRRSSQSASTAAVLRLLGNYGHFDGGFGEIESENDSPEGVVTLGQSNTTTSNYNGLFWSFGNCDVRCKDFQALPTPNYIDGVGIYIPSSAPVFGSSAANYYGSVYNVRVFRATTAYWLTDQANAHTFVNCSVEFFWFYAWRLNGAYGNTVYGGFINACYRNGGTAFLLGNRLAPSAPHAAGHQSISNQFFGSTIELYTSGNFGVEIPVGASGLESIRNLLQFNWNSTGTPIVDNTTLRENTITDTNTDFRVGQNFTMPPSTSSGRQLLRVGSSAYADNHCIARDQPPGAPTLIVENLNATSAPAYGLQLRWNTPIIGYNSSIISTYHSPSATTRFRVLDTGDVQNTNNSYGAISDRKYKNVIGPCGSQWEDVKYLAKKLAKYSLRDDPEQMTQLGWVAQEIEDVCPGLVFETPDLRTVERTENGETRLQQEPTGETSKGVHYSVASLKAIKALGEAMERIEALEANATRKRALS